MFSDNTKDPQGAPLYRIMSEHFFLIVFPDVEDPTISCPGNKTLETMPGQPTAVAAYDPKVFDNSRQNLNASCSAESGSQFEIGQTDVICEAYDPSGNRAMCHFTVDVQGEQMK